MLDVDNQRLQRAATGGGSPKRLGKYELIARIGKGGMAEVYLARQRGPMNFEKVVVVKTIHSHLAAQKEFIDMLLDEARIAALLKHPSVVDIYELGEHNETYFIAMEYLPGQPLLSVLRAGRETKRPLTIFNACRIMADVAGGLHAAHELKDSAGRPLDLVHRDITPGNIVVLYSGQVKLVDFGIAKARGRMAMETNARQLKGKLGYVAPEQIRGKGVDRRADIFALGVVLWEALTYRRLFRGNDPNSVLTAILKKDLVPPSAHRPEVPSTLDDICLRALAREPAKRYGSASELHEDLEKFLAEAGALLQTRVIAEYMGEVFSKEIQAHEQLLRETANAQEIIEAPTRRAPSFTEESSSDPAAGEDEAAGGPAANGKSRSGEDESPETLANQYLITLGDTATGAGPSPGQSGDDNRHSAQALGTGDVLLPRLSSRSSGPLGGPLSTVSLPAMARPTNRQLWIAGGGVLGLIVVLALVLGDNGGTTDKASAPAAGKPAQTATAPQEPSPAVAVAEQAGLVIHSGEPGTQTDNGLAATPVEQPDDAQPTQPMRPASSSAARTGSAAKASPAETRDRGATAGKSQGRQASARQQPSPGAGTAGEAEALYKQGLTLFVQGNVAEAQRRFWAALRLRPGYAQPYRGLGMVYERIGNKKKAAEAFRTYLRMAPNAADREKIHKRLSELDG